MPITSIVQADTPESIVLPIHLANRFGLREVKRLISKGVEDLEKMRKKLGDEGINSDIPQRLRVWNGTDGHVGVLAQIAEQIEAFMPKGEPDPDPIEGDDPRQIDAFADGAAPAPGPDPFDAAPVATDPTAAAPGISPETLRDALARAHVYIPAVVLATWTDEQREAAETWACAAHLSREGAEDVEVPERPALCESYALPEDYQRLDDGSVLGPAGRPMDPETLASIWESWAAKRVAPVETVLHGLTAWRVVDLGVGEGLARYEVMNIDTRERMTVDAAWCDENEPLPLDVEQTDYQDQAQTYALYLSEQVQPIGDEAAVTPDDDAPAPAMVRAALLHAMYDVPVEVAAQWGPFRRRQAVEYGYAAGDDGIVVPAFLKAVAWDVDPETGVHSYPAQTFNFELAGKRKPVRILDRDSGRYYGDTWTMDEAEVVLVAWNNGEPADLPGYGRLLQVRDARVAMEEKKPVVGDGGEG